ncbi:MAG: NAD(P)H-hydrate dehydratase [archaeon]|nr:MAG: NAD(P)H-hydrate dehydratase [archaeon]
MEQSSAVVTRDILKKVFLKRKVDAHKYQFGSLLVIGGSKLYHGSPLFNALGAYKTGVDLVTVIAPERAANIIASYGPDLITYPLKGDCIEEKHVKIMEKFAEKCDAIVIGGGTGRQTKTKEAVRKFLKKIKKPVVLDADALHVIRPSDIRKNFVLTPHTEEFKTLSGLNATRKNIEKFARKHNCVILLTHSKDIITNGKETFENWTGNPYMTVGGTGDILAGICGSLLAQGASPMNAACAAAYVNGMAGDLAAKVKKQALMASDILGYIEKVF